MSFFALPYRILFHDTMAYGSHHHMVNLKLQNIVRETILFESKVDGKDCWREQLKDLVIFTREAYSRNLAPVGLGEKVAVLLSYEDPSRSSMRLCFRIVRADGQPVSCGYQTMIVAHKDTQELVPAPPLLTQYLSDEQGFSLLEELTGPSFGERIHGGPETLHQIFSPDVIAIGTKVANLPAAEAGPLIIDRALRVHSLDRPAKLPSGTAASVVFTFPGQGSYRRELLEELHHLDPARTRKYFEAADRVTERFLGKPFTPLATSSPRRSSQLLRECPELKQFGIYLGEVLLARHAMRSGLRPDLLLGHSFGELAALVTAGMFSIEEGLEIVGHRLASLRPLAGSGAMAAVSCECERVREILGEEDDRGVQVSVINHPKQTVLSGPREGLEQLRERFNGLGLSLTILDSPYPFHSALLAPSVEPFRAKLESIRFTPPRVPVYLATAGQLLESVPPDLPELLSAQLVRCLDFRGAVEMLLERGFRIFLECGGGDIVSKIIHANRGGRRQVAALSTTPAAGLEAGLEKVFDLCRTRGVPLAEGESREPAAAPAPSAAAAVAERPDPAEPAPRTAHCYEPESSLDSPVAVVAMGCVLPGASDPDQYWRNIREGVSGIVDLVQVDPDLGRDFVAGGAEAVVPDKSYTMLNGAILEVPFQPSLLGSHYDQEAFTRLTRAQKLLASALAQTLGGLQAADAKREASRVQCVLGGTADGCAEYDEAEFLESLSRVVDDLEAPPELRRALSDHLEKLWGHHRGDASRLSQCGIYPDVVTRLLSQGVKTWVVDTACSSSLYSIYLGMKVLERGEADLVLAGGVFGPGPANNTLFAQFRGLTPRQSRPLDVAADGVVFGDGAALVALKRLGDALQAGDRIWGVIRAIGLSSDGKSPSINVPRKKGQKLALQRAYRRSGIEPSSIQYLEAHATATPVGDGVEFQASSEFFGADRAGAAPLELGSVKALIGHTGWVSGVASLIKLLKALEHQSVPRQYNYSAPNPAIDLGNSPFRIALEEHPWPANRDGLPRRAGINAFGFGGTNSHLILEEFRPEYHGGLIERLNREAGSGRELAVVGWAALFPGSGQLVSDTPSRQRVFDRQKFRLPKKKILLPDITEAMDCSQFLAALAAEGILDSWPATWTQFQDDLAVVLGVESKTENGIRSNERIFLDRLRRRFAEDQVESPTARDELRPLFDRLLARIEENQPSGPYTLPGLMPNVAAGRICHLFDLHGPNIVIDRGEASLFEALRTARALLYSRESEVVLSGALNGLGARDGSSEAVLLLALARPETAARLGLPVRATLELVDAADDPPEELVTAGDGVSYRGAQGAPELLKALQESGAQKTRRSILEIGGGGALVFSPPAPAASVEEPAPPREEQLPGTHAYVQGTPIHYYTPQLVAAPLSGSRPSLRERRILFLTDQPEPWAQVERLLGERGLSFRVAAPASRRVEGAIPIDLVSEDTVGHTLGGLEATPVDTIVAWKDLSRRDPEALLEENWSDQAAFLDLLFSVSRHYYPRISRGEVEIVSVCITESPGLLEPYTGLVGGFMKSLARELPRSRVKALQSDAQRAEDLLPQLEGELAQPPSVCEACYVQGRRLAFELRRLESLASAGPSVLTPESVVLASGGARGVTAVLVEELLRRHGCTVVALGRTGLEGVPPELLEMGVTELEAFEPQFYRERLEADASQKIPQLKALFRRYQAANEVAQLCRHMSELPGTFEYCITDLNEPEAVEAVVRRVWERHGRLDLVVHGAGVQVSRALPRKTLSDFRRIASTKVGGLGLLYRACLGQSGGRPVHFHLLTSAFSYLGNDGQPDYGAANEALNRLAASMSGRRGAGQWSSLAWLGWAGIGMTRGSEFAALAASRRLRGINREEGQAIFREMMQGPPLVPINVLLAEGEKKYYGAVTREEPGPLSPAPAGSAAIQQEGSLTVPWDIDLESAPYLLDHTVHGVPTLPGAFIIAIAGDAAKKLRPQLKIVSFEDTTFRSFVRVFPKRGSKIRARAEVVSEDAAESFIRVQLRSDFIHESGLVLRKDILQTEIFVRMACESPSPPEPPDINGLRGRSLPDPYVMQGSPVRLNGPFICLDNLVVGRGERRADYQLSEASRRPSPYQYLTPNILMVDAFWRFGTIQPVGDKTLAVYVPERCRSMKVYFDFLNFEFQPLFDKLTFLGSNPQQDGSRLHVGPIQVVDPAGKTLLTVEGGVCRKFGEIADAF